MSTRERKTKRQPPRLDPIFPLPFGTGISPLRQGEGAAHLRNDQIIPGTEGLSWRAFYVMWEQVEIRAAQNYPRYVGGPMDHAAQAWLEAVIYFRKIANPETQMKVWPEEKAKKARKWWKAEDKRLAELAKKKKGKAAPEEDGEPKAKKKRCAAEKKGVRCRGPLGHGGKHKGVTAKGKRVSWL